MLTESQLDQRMPVWCALADLFLDTELQRADYHHIAAVLRTSAYSIDELRTIFEKEVSPAFVFNLMDVAGEWAGWTEESVREIMVRSLRNKGLGSSLRGIRLAIFRQDLNREWEKIAALLASGSE